MEEPHVYDKAKYHYESIEQLGLSEEHASNHTVFFLRWLIDNELMNEWFVEETGKLLKEFRKGKATIHDVYESWDCCLIDDMLSEEGNTFALAYFEFETGQYIHDYSKTLQQKLPTEFHVDYTEENYQRLKRVIDQRYSKWKTKKKR
jgi:hypothetical protein